jgi:hypothetical protein
MLVVQAAIRQRKAALVISQYFDSAACSFIISIGILDNVIDDNVRPVNLLQHSCRCFNISWNTKIR